MHLHFFLETFLIFFCLNYAKYSQSIVSSSTKDTSLRLLYNDFNIIGAIYRFLCLFESLFINKALVWVDWHNLISIINYFGYYTWKIVKNNQDLISDYIPKFLLKLGWKASDINVNTILVVPTILSPLGSKVIDVRNLAIVLDRISNCLNKM